MGINAGDLILAAVPMFHANIGLPFAVPASGRGIGVSATMTAPAWSR